MKQRKLMNADCPPRRHKLSDDVGSLMCDGGNIAVRVFFVVIILPKCMLQSVPGL
jgi:hypothetical protein